MRGVRAAGLLSAALVGALAAACREKQPEEPLIIGPVGSPNASIFAVKCLLNTGGDGQTGTVGNALGDSLCVRVVTSTGFPVGGVLVQWAADSGGSISPAVNSTNNDGIAKARWTLGSKPGLQSATASADKTPHPPQFWAIATGQSLPEGMYFMVSGGGNRQVAPAGSALPDSIGVRLVTATGFPIVGVAIYWSITGGGSISPTVSYTNNDGVAKARWTLGPQPGEQRASGSPHLDRNPHYAIVATALEPVAGLPGSAGRER